MTVQIGHAFFLITFDETGKDAGNLELLLEKNPLYSLINWVAAEKKDNSPWVQNKRLRPFTQGLTFYFDSFLAVVLVEAFQNKIRMNHSGFNLLKKKNSLDYPPVLDTKQDFSSVSFSLQVLPRLENNFLPRFRAPYFFRMEGLTQKGESFESTLDADELPVNITKAAATISDLNRLLELIVIRSLSWVTLNFFQAGFAYVVQEFMDGRNVSLEGLSQKLRKRKLYEVNVIEITSLKLILDPHDGLERLRLDILEGRFMDSIRPPLFYKNMLQLLEILRVSQTAEEISILSSLQEYEPDFFLEVQKLILSESILPYIRTEEVQKIIADMDPKIQASLFFSSWETKGLYRRFFSKNNYADLQRLSNQLKEKNKGTENLVFPEIARLLQGRYRIPCRIKGSETFFFECEPIPHTLNLLLLALRQQDAVLLSFLQVLEPKSDSGALRMHRHRFKNRDFYRIPGIANFSETAGEARLAYLDPSNLILLIRKPLRQLSILIETPGFRLSKKNFEGLDTGVLVLKYEMPVIKKILIGTLDYSAQISESIYIYKP